MYTVHCVQQVLEVRGTLNPLALKLQKVLGIEPRSSRKASSACNHWAIAPDPILLFNILKFWKGIQSTDMCPLFIDLMILNISSHYLQILKSILDKAYLALTRTISILKTSYLYCAQIHMERGLFTWSMLFPRFFKKLLIKYINIKILKSWISSLYLSPPPR